MALKRPLGVIRFAAGIKMQDDAGDVPPIGTFCIRIQQTQIRDCVLVVIRRQDRGRWCRIGDVRIKWHLHAQAFATMSTEHSALCSWQIDDGTGAPYPPPPLPIQRAQYGSAHVRHGNAALKLAVPMWHASQSIGTADMIIIACAIGAIVILGYCAVVLTYLRRLPEQQD
jgi:hypothetical protein